MMRLRSLALVAMALAFSSAPAAHASRPVAAREHVANPDTATTTRFEVDGIPVILRHNTANEVVTANLYLLGGTRQLTPATAGIETLLLAASERGTRHYPGATMRQRTARLGSEIGVEPSEDWTAISLRTIRSDFDSSWALLADRVIAPTLSPGEVALVREQLLTAARMRGTQPDDAATELADSLLYVGHPYALQAEGTATSIAGLTVPQLKTYQAQQMVRSRMLLVVVGNVDRAQVQRLVHSTLGALPLGTYRWTAPPPIVPLGAAVAIDNRMLPTNYLLGYVAGPSARSSDYAALRVATAVLSGRLFTEVRSRRNLSYAVESPFIDGASAVAGLYVTTVDPNAVLRIMRDELTTLQTQQVDAEGLKRLEQQFITEFYLKNETNADQANMLARAELYAGDYREADRFMAQVERVTPADVQRAAQKYLKGFRFAYVGDAAKVDRNLLALF